MRPLLPATELEDSFQAEGRSIFAKRQQIIEGKREPTDEEVSLAKVVGDVTRGLPEASKAVDPAGVPFFWPVAMRMWLDEAKELEGEVVEVTDADWRVLDHLREIRVEPWTPPDMDLMPELELPEITAPAFGADEDNPSPPKMSITQVQFCTYFQT